MAFHAHQLIIQVGQLGFQFFQPFFGGRVRFLLQGLALNLGLGDFTLYFINFSRHAVNFNSQFGSAFIN